MYGDHGSWHTIWQWFESWAVLWGSSIIVYYEHVSIIDTTLGYRSRSFVPQTPIIVSAAGFEPGTLRLQGRSSNHYTNSLSKHWALTQCLDSTVWWSWLLTHYMVMVRIMSRSLRILSIEYHVIICNHYRYYAWTPFQELCNSDPHYSVSVRTRTWEIAITRP